MEIALSIYIGLIFLIIIGSIFWAGYDGQSVWETEEFIGNILIVAFAWPLLLILLCFYAPFWGVYQLGKYLRARGNKDI